MFKNLVPETGTKNVHKFLERVSCILVPVFFWYQQLAANRTQLYLVQVFGSSNLYKILKHVSHLCMFLVQVFGTRFFSVSPLLILEMRCYIPIIEIPNSDKQLQ